MTSSPNTDKLAAALVAFQGQAPAIPKNRTAKIPTKSGPGYSYRYADLSDMWDAIRRPLHANGLAVTQLLCASSPGCMGIKTTIWHESGQNVTDMCEFPVAGKSPQEVGSAVTYYKRYALGAALGLSTDEDDDGNAATRAEPEPDPQAQALSDLLALAKRKGIEPADIAKRFHEAHGLDIRKADVDTIRAFAKAVNGG